MKSTLRQLLKSPGFTLVAVLTLALGIGANTAVFTVVDGILLQPLPWPDSHRVLSLWEGNPTKGHARTPMAPAQFLDLRRDAKSFQALAGWNPAAVNLAPEDGTPERHQGALVTEDFLKVVGVAPILGRGFQSEQFEAGKDGVVLIGHGVWMETFGGRPDVVGKPILINGRTRVVSGVLPPGFQTPAKARFWVPKVFSAFEKEDRDLKSLSVFGRLVDGASPEQARSELQTLFAGLRDGHPDVLTGWDVDAHPALEDVAGPLRPTLFTLLAAVAMVLLLACLNVAGLALARGMVRQGELSVRAALGADRARLMRQLLLEGLLLTGLGGLVGLLLAQGLLSALLAMAPASLPRLESIRLNGTALAFTAGACVLTGLFFGLLPAWQLSRVNPLDALRQVGGRATASVGWLRHGLVVVQVGAALSVLLATGLLLRSLDRLMRQELGFDPEHRMTVRLELPPIRYGADHRREQFAEEVLHGLAATPGVEAAAATTFLPLQGWPRYILRLEEKADVRVSDAPSTGYQGISPTYFNTMGMPLVQGRGFTDADREDSVKVAVVNRAFARKFFGDRDPVGRRVEVGFSEPPAWLEIVGVVTDTKGPSLEAQPDEQVFVPLRQQEGVLRGSPALSLVVRGRGDPAALAEGIRQAVWKLDRAQPLHLLKPMTQIVEEQTAQRRFTVTVLGVFAGTAVLLAALGLYGVMSSGVTARTRELGIRLALGSQRSGLMGLVLRRGAALTSAGIALGWLGALAGSRLLRSLLFGIEPMDPVTFGLVPLLLALVALVACWIPARRASRVDPMVALRAE